MNEELLEKLVDEYKKAFINSFEAGGGYGFRFDHGVRVMTYTQKFLELSYFKDKKIDMTAAMIAALFADIGKVAAMDEKGEIIYGSQGDLDHAEIGANMMPEILAKYTDDQKLIAFVREIIDEQHGKEQASLESKIVKDADRFDNYGFIVAWRHITYAQYDKRRVDRLNEFWLGEKAREKALSYLEKFHFPFTKALAMKRFEKFDYFMKEIEVEVKGKDIVEEA
jgi:HD superfamily phosphodiesterase